jgi:hypothetical protein
MSDKKDKPKKDPYVIRIDRRLWYIWLIWGIWLLLVVFFLQGALASIQEHEPRASILFLGFFTALVLTAVIYWIIRKNKLL